MFTALLFPRYHLGTLINKIKNLFNKLEQVQVLLSVQASEILVGYCPPLCKKIKMTPNMDCYRVGAVPKL